MKMQDFTCRFLPNFLVSHKSTAHLKTNSNEKINQSDLLAAPIAYERL
jgi:hypothetical protein